CWKKNLILAVDRWSQEINMLLSMAPNIHVDSQDARSKFKLSRSGHDGHIFAAKLALHELQLELHPLTLVLLDTNLMITLQELDRLVASVRSNGHRWKWDLIPSRAAILPAVGVSRTEAAESTEDTLLASEVMIKIHAAATNFKDRAATKAAELLGLLIKFLLVFFFIIIRKEKEADAKRIADLEYALSIQVGLHRSKVAELEKKLDEIFAVIQPDFLELCTMQYPFIANNLWMVLNNWINEWWTIFLSHVAHGIDIGLIFRS
ncbi:hypothetical protein ACJX0J_030287, partial [Zea mays]